MIRLLLHRLTTDVPALRRRIAELEAANAELTRERDDLLADSRYLDSADAELRRDIGREFDIADPADSPPCWGDIVDALRDAHEEITRLRALAGNTKATPAEVELLDVVRANPGALARDVGRLLLLKDGPPSWIRGYSDEDTWPWPGHIADAVKPLTSLYRKGLVRRERDGQTYRYWPTEGA